MTPTHATQDKDMSTTKLMKGTKSHGGNTYLHDMHLWEKRCNLQAS